MLVIVIAIVAALFGSNYLINRHPPATKQVAPSNTTEGKKIDFSRIAEQVYPAQGFVLPVKWSNAAKRLVDYGALNVSFMANTLYSANQPLTNEELEVLNGSSDNNVTLNSSNGIFTLYVLWALGINNKNKIISNGPIMDYGNPYQYASTGGYEQLGKLQLGNLSIINFNGTEQSIIETVASDVYRPCCDNSAIFPDCNHGAAQLGLIELMASQGSNATEIYGAIKEFDSFYYAQQYFDDALFFNITQNKTWNEIPANQILGYDFSSATGTSNVYRYLLSSNALVDMRQGSSGACGVVQ